MAPSKPVRFGIWRFLGLVLAAKRTINSPVPLKVLPRLSVLPDVVLVFSKTTVVPAAMATALVPSPLAPVVTLACSVPALTVVCPE